MKDKITLGVIVMITLTTMSIITLQSMSQSANATLVPAVTGENIYIVLCDRPFPSNNPTGPMEIFFMASNDNGQSFGNKINLSNSTNTNSTMVDIDSDADNVVVTWWETDQAGEKPVMRISNDQGSNIWTIDETIG